MQLLLAVDIGNTNTVVALFKKNTVVHQWRIYSDTKRTADEYTSTVRSLFRDAGVLPSEVDSGILSSVVPLLTGPFISVAVNLIGKKPLIVGPNVFNKLPIKIPETAVHEIGSDIVCNAVEAYCRFHKSCIIADFGTALTFTAVDCNGNIQGVAILPGLGTAVRSLFNNTAQLPSVPLEAPPDTLGKNTVHSIQAGIVLGYKGLTEALIGQMKNDLCNKTGCTSADIRVIATGGLNSVVKPISDVLQEVDKQLTLYGLHRIAVLCAGE
ncbi:type III pantothenate kinase [Treponema lecithinolyticum]|uniref:type III pantothenate kinase n=1 Tax=Treponema lecithinolyticum TaxID=53418 RepID=UPI00041C8612|nr:type III pantothenate kinase [Treponema lecithinolyticum]